MAARIRTLADAVADLTEEVRLARTMVGSVDVSKLDGRARAAVQHVAVSLDAFTRELARTNSHLADLARRPIVGILGGGAEGELQRLVTKVDALREQLGGWRALVPE